MITTNIDVEEGIVNGAVGVLKNIQLLSEGQYYGDLEKQGEPPTSVATDKPLFKLWMESPLEMIDQRCRLKAELNVT
ncbi:hypothetical protein TNCT_393611 [Trichonephila clavata]|uniref:Uncharacterized protein n=1 Tax=Trichonephila clavata TaxID=2740835 RepID=A0A8X6JNU2_TRICU|nr:hypothetical protein TNCT_393611 [Trichonephila clavata]